MIAFYACLNQSFVLYLSKTIGNNDKTKTQKMEITRFETGNIYEMRFIGDSDLRPQFICIKRTAKTATFQRFQKTETLTRRIKEYDGVEYILAGTYSMAPRIKADKIAG